MVKNIDQLISVVCTDFLHLLVILKTLFILCIIVIIGDRTLQCKSTEHKRQVSKSLPLKVFGTFENISEIMDNLRFQI